MKNFLRLGSSIIALGLAGLFTGCSSSSNVTQRTRLAHDFEVVETSTKRTLNTAEMAVLRAKVAEYLDKQGATSSGNYYVKVFLGADQEGVPAEWVVVRFSRDMDMRFQLLGSDDSYYSVSPAYAAYDYYPAGYDSFGRVSFQYYNDPYYGGGYYFPPDRRDNRDRNRNHDGDHDRDKDRDHDGDRKGNDNHSRPPQDPPHFTPGNQVTPPQVTHTRWDHDRPGQNDAPHENSSPRHNASVHPQSDHANEQTYTPPIRTSSQSAPRTESSSSNSAPSQPSFRTSSQSAPSYSQPVTRSESSQGSNPNQGSRETKSSTTQREKME